MDMTQEKRLEQILKNNHFNYTIQEVFEVFALFMESYEQNSTTVANIKKKITKGEWNSLVNGLGMSFFMSLHAYKLPIDEALDLAMTEGVIGVGIAEVHNDK